MRTWYNIVREDFCHEDGKLPISFQTEKHLIMPMLYVPICCFSLRPPSTTIQMGQALVSRKQNDCGTVAGFSLYWKIFHLGLIFLKVMGPRIGAEVVQKSRLAISMRQYHAVKQWNRICKINVPVRSYKIIL